MDTSANIFTPAIYHGLPEYKKKNAVDLSLMEVTTLVRMRAMDDGLWCIHNNLVGNNMNKMLEMILSCCNQERITKCFGRAAQEGLNLDFVCRDLANGSRWQLGSS